MDPRHSQQPRPDRPNTLGHAWQRMQTPPRYELPDLPVLPNWPPLPDERAQAGWPSLNSWASDGSSPGAVQPPTQHDDTLRPAPAPAAPQPQGWRDILRRLQSLRSASTRTRHGISVGVACLFLVLVVACSSLALRTASGLLTGLFSVSAPGDTAASLQTAGPSGMSSPLLTVTTQATGQPTPTAAPTQPLTVVFTCARGSLRGMGQVCVQTQPQTVLSLTVHYCDGSTAKGLHGSATADASGTYTWSWPIRTSSCAGPATATVTATWNGQSLTQSDTFTITP